MQLGGVEAFACAVHLGQGVGQYAQAFLDLSVPTQGFGQQGEEVSPGSHRLPVAAQAVRPCAAGQCRWLPPPARPGPTHA